MRELEQKQKLRRRMYSMPSLVILTIITLIIIRGAYYLVLKERSSARDASLLMAKVGTLRDREKVLTGEIGKLTTPAGIEEEIKSKFNVARDGERVAVIVDKPDSATSTAPKPAPWYKRLWDDIVGK